MLSIYSAVAPPPPIKYKKAYHQESAFLKKLIAATCVRHTMEIDKESDQDPQESDYKAFDVLVSEGQPILFIRESYEKLYDFLSLKTYTLINGNPGFGKSFFAFFVIYRLMQEKVDIIYVNKAGEFSAFINREGVVEVASASTADRRLLTNHMEEEVNTWYIHDCGTKFGRPDPVIANCCAKTVVFSSPCKSNYAQFLKAAMRSGYNTFYLPPWSIEECRAWNMVQGNSVDYEEKFWHWGGNARKVFGHEDEVDELVQAIKDVDHLTILSKLKDVAAGCGDNYSHQLLHMTPTDDTYKKIEVVFASPFVAREVYKEIVKKSIDGVLKLISEPTLASIRGPLFEQFSHEKFFKKGEYPVRNLTDNTLSTLEVNVDGRKNFRKLSEVVTGNEYYYPVSTKFKSVDSILPTHTAFQMTVSEDHPVQYEGLRVVVEQLKCPVLNFYYVVPCEIFANFKLQNYLTTANKVCQNQNRKDIQQFVLSMDIEL